MTAKKIYSNEHETTILGAEIRPRGAFMAYITKSPSFSTTSSQRNPISLHSAHSTTPYFSSTTPLYFFSARSSRPWRLMLFGLSIGNPSALSHTNCANGPSPLLTPNVAV